MPTPARAPTPFLADEAPEFAAKEEALQDKSPPGTRPSTRAYREDFDRPDPSPPPAPVAPAPQAPKVKTMPEEYTPTATSPNAPGGAMVPRGTIAMPQRPVMAPGQAAQYTAQSAAGADTNRAAYDAYTKQALGATPAEAMRLAQQAAAGGAQAESDAAVRQAIKAAKTAGATRGQAALSAQGQAADAYSRGLQRGQQQYFDTTQLGAQLGSEAANRLARAAGIEAGQESSRLGAQTSMYGTDVAAATSQYATDAAERAGKSAANQQLFGNVLGTVGGIAALFSDKNLKEDIAPTSFSDGLKKIQAYTYRYKGGTRPEAGIMAQDLERGSMAPAVIDTPEGKMVDTRRLSTMNTAALSEHEKRLGDIEKLVKSLGEVRR